MMTKILNKTAEIARLVRRKRGATLNELMDVTGWQPHSVRGQISRLRKEGMKVEVTKTPKRGTLYHGHNGG